MNTKPLVIIQMGHPPEDIAAQFGEQGQWMQAALADVHPDLRVVHPFRGDALPSVSAISGAVLTGSWSMVTDKEPWSERTADWVRQAMEVGLPLLGVCYGHQLMAHALGGVVDFHPAGREIGQHEITLSARGIDDPVDPLLARLPARFLANLSHEQSVITPPAGARVLASSAHDPHQILRYGEHALSVQFHPEFFPGLMAACLNRRTDKFVAEGFDIAAMCAALEPTEHARELLRDFARPLAFNHAMV